MKKYFFLVMISVGTFLSCSGDEAATSADTSALRTVDSMPVFQPQVTDSSSIITTPQTNDDNAILPDSSRR